MKTYLRKSIQTLHFLFAVLLFQSLPTLAKENLSDNHSFSTSISPFVISYFEHPQIEKYKSLIEKSYRDIGIKVTFVQIEGERASLSVQNGLVDADVINDPYVAKSFDNMTAVGPSLTTANIFLICRKEIVCNSSVLKDSTKLVLTESSLTYSLRELVKFDIQSELKVLNNTANLLELLKLGRIDYIIFGLESGEIPDEIAQYTQTSFLYLLGTYHYVNSKHEGIFPQLEKAIVHNLALEKKNN